MAKEKRSAADLDAELAALEAELAALEGKPKKAKAEKPKPAPKAEPAAAPAEPSPEPAKEEKKSRFAMPSMPKLGKKKAEPAPLPPPPPPGAEPDVTEAMSEPAPRPSAPALRASSYDLSLWRQDGDAWVRSVPETPVPVVRRVLDENGAMVREEVASMSDVDAASGVKAERGIGRLLRRK